MKPIMETTKTRPHKATPSHTALHARIASVERRLENRRTRLLEDAQEAGSAASQTASRVLPLAAALGAGALALYLTRRRTHRPAYAAFADAGPDATTRRGVRWASILGILGTVLRIATSPQLRAILHNLNERRRRY
jgi:hypothetical protein